MKLGNCGMIFRIVFLYEDSTDNSDRKYLGKVAVSDSYWYFERIQVHKSTRIGYNCMMSPIVISIFYLASANDLAHQQAFVQGWNLERV